MGSHKLIRRCQQKNGSKERTCRQNSYFGTYARFDTLSKKDAATLLGADNLVGDVFDIVFQTEDGVSTAWMKNRFGGLVGYFDPSFSRKLSVFAARGWNLRALLSFVAFTDKPEPGHYWGQAAVICYDPSLEQTLSPFIASTASRLSDGVRPDVDLGEQAVEQLISSDGAWNPKKNRAAPLEGVGHGHHEEPSQNVREDDRTGPQGQQRLLRRQLAVPPAPHCARTVRS